MDIRADVTGYCAIKLTDQHLPGPCCLLIERLVSSGISPSLQLQDVWPDVNRDSGCNICYDCSTGTFLSHCSVTGRVVCGVFQYSVCLIGHTHATGLNNTRVLIEHSDNTDSSTGYLKYFPFMYLLCG